VVQIAAEAMQDYQALVAFRNLHGSSFAPKQILDVGEQLARLQAYEEIPSQDLAAFIEDTRKDTYSSYPFGGPRNEWSGALYGGPEQEWWIATVLKESSALRQRFLVALFGGYILLIPMLIMTLNPTLLTALLTTTVCVLGVAVFIAIQFNTAEPKDLLSIAAGYAAVLVVFVGTSTTMETMKRGVVAGIVVGVLLGGTALAFVFVYLLRFREVRRREKQKKS
jgi:hypothetical protein